MKSESRSIVVNVIGRFLALRQRRRELRFVRDVVFYLDDRDRLYIHPVEGGGATILITPYDPLPKYDHAHIKGPPHA